MGLFDSFLDSNNSNDGGGGGLLGRLIAQFGQQQAPAYSGLPSDQAQYANPMPLLQAPQSQAMQPGPMDNAQWPYGPNGAPSQANASTVQQQPAPSAVPAPTGLFGSMMQPGGASSSPGIGDRLSAGLQSFAHGGALIPAIADGIAGFASGQRTDPSAVAQQQQKQSLKSRYDVLAPIVGHEKALLAVLDPEVSGKKIIEAAFGPGQFSSAGNGYVLNNQTGATRRAFEPEETPDKKPTSVLEYNFYRNNLGKGEAPVSYQKWLATKDTDPSAAGAGGLGNMELTGKEYLATLPKDQANTVQMMTEGRMPPPSSFALSKPYWQSMIAAARNYDPTFDATNWSGRVAGVRDYSAGKSSEMVRSANQTLHHVGALLDSMDALKNGSYPLLNRIGNTAREATGSGEQGAFRSNAHAVSTELSKVFKGSNLSDAEIHSWEANLHENMSPEQQRAQVAKLGELLHGSLQALEEKRLNSMGPMAAEKAGPLIKEEGRRVLSRISEWIMGGGKPAAPASLSAGQAAKVGNVTIRRID